MHLCVISDFLDESFQDYFALSCEVATKTGTPLFSSGIFWTGTVSPQPPALSLAHPCLCQIPLEPSSAHLLKENTTKHQLFFFFQKLIITVSTGEIPCPSLLRRHSHDNGEHIEEKTKPGTSFSKLSWPNPPPPLNGSLWQPIGS